MKKFFLFLNLFLIFLLYSNSLKISLKDSINICLKNNIDIRKEYLTNYEKRLNLITSFNKFYPDINFSTSISSNYDFNKNQYQNTIRPGFSISLSLQAKTFFDIRDSYIDYQNGIISIEKLQATLIKNVKLNYFNIVLLSNEIRIKEQSLKNFENRYKKSLIQYKDGEISQLDLLNEEFLYKSQIPDLIKIKNEYNNLLNQFKILIGLSLEDEIELIDNLPDLDNINIEDIEKKSLDNNFDIKAIYYKIDKEKNLRYSQISTFTPTIRLSYSLNSGFNKDIFTNYWFLDVNKDWNSSSSFSFSITQPLKFVFPFSSEQIFFIKSDNTLQKYYFDLEYEQKQKRNLLKNYLNKLNQIKETKNLLKLNIEISEKIYKLTEAAYFEGTKNSLDVNEAIKSLDESKLKYDKALFDYYNYLLEIEFLLNIKLIN